MSEPQAPVVSPGDTVEGRYRIIKPLDEGGMGTVFLAEHVLIKRRVAIKFLRPELATDADVIERFMNEARAAGTLGHPNIVESTDMGFTRGDLPYIVFEYLEGSLLVDEIYRARGLRVARAIRIAYQIASALQAAHSAGIVHRDLKSENIFLTFREERPDHVKVLDFGVSRFAEAEADAARAEQRVIGTPEFMAPEQITSPGSVDRRADIYALGVILYEMISARRPFPNEGDLEATMRRVVSDPPPPLGVAGVPPGLSEMICEKLLAKDPEQRYASMKDAQSALEAFHSIARPTGSLTPLSIPIPTPPADEPAPPAARVVELPERRRGARGLPLLVGALLVGAGAVALSFVAPPAAPPPPSDAPARAALHGEAVQVAQTIEDVVRATRMRSDAMAATPLLRAAIETDAATLRDMAKSERLFNPAPGDVIQVFQDRGGKSTLLLRLPEASAALPELKPGQAQVHGTPSGGVVALVASQVTNQAGAPSGTLEIGASLDLSHVAHTVPHAGSITLVGLGAPVPLGSGSAAPAVGRTEQVSAPVALPAGLAAGAVSVEANVTLPTPVRTPDRVRPFRIGAWVLAALLSLLYVGSLLKTRRQR